MRMDGRLMCLINSGHFHGPRVFEACEAHQYARVAGQGTASVEEWARYLVVTDERRGAGRMRGCLPHSEHGASMVEYDLMLIRKGPRRDEVAAHPGEHH